MMLDKIKIIKISRLKKEELFIIDLLNGLIIEEIDNFGRIDLQNPIFRYYNYNIEPYIGKRVLLYCLGNKKMYICDSVIDSMQDKFDYLNDKECLILIKKHITPQLNVEITEFIIDTL